MLSTIGILTLKEEVKNWYSDVYFIEGIGFWLGGALEDLNTKKLKSYFNSCF